MACSYEDLETMAAGGVHPGQPGALDRALAAMVEREGDARPGPALAALLGSLGDLEAAADREGYAGLADGCRLLMACGGDAGEASAGGTTPLLETLLAWPGAVGRYLAAPRDPESTEALLEAMRRGGALPPEADDETELLRAVLVEGCLDGAEGADDATSPVGEDPDREGPQDGGVADLLTLLEDEPAGGQAEALPGAAAAQPAVAATVAPAPEPASSVGPPEAGAGMSAAVQELLDLLTGELQVLGEETGQALVVATEHTDAPIRGAALARLDEHWERFGAAAGVAGLSGLQRCCEALRGNLAALAAAAEPLAAPLASAIGGWPARVSAYVRAPGRPESVEALIEDLCDPVWPRPLAAEEAAGLRGDLSHQELPDAGPEAPARARTATPGDISLEVPADVDPDLLDALLQELPGQTEALSGAVQRLQAGGGEEDLAVAQRIAHTLKGAGNTVGIPGIAVLTHAMEDIFLALKRAGVMPPRSLAGSLLEATDCLEGMSDTLMGGGPPPEEAMGVLQSILDWANRIDREGVPGPGAEPVPEPPEPAAAPREAQAPGPAPRPAAEAGIPQPAGPEPAGDDPGAMIRVPAGLVDGLLTLVGESMILTVQVRERLRRASEHSRAMHAQFDLLEQLGHDLEEIIDVREPGVPKAAVPVDRGFDALELEEYDELYTHARRLVEAATDARELGGALGGQLSDLDDMLVAQERLEAQTQETVLRTRMVPVKTLFPRLQRAVRQVCRLTGKQAELHLSGGSTLMDSEVLGDIADALMHLLRNAVDHGIEEPEQRRSRGKDPAGHVWLDFGRDGNQILIRCRDDGSGLDPQAIQATAEAQNLVAGARQLGDEELKRLVLRANFSTRREVSQTSGRGIGLDAVHSRVAELGGSLGLDSAAGAGLAVELRLPVTLISSHALLARVGRHVVAIANRGVTQILPGNAGELRQVGEELAWHTSEAVYPALRLEAVLGTAHEQRGQDRAPRPALLVQGEDGLTALLVESLLDSRELVVKPLGRYLPRRRGLVGATILGDGSVAPVLDLPELLRSRGQPGLDEDTGHGRTEEVAAELPSALVVDDSLSARRALAQCLQDSGFQVRVARDGLEAAEIAAGSRPDIVLADLEMPRMNGIELAAHLRGRPETSALPIIMVTSRSTAKHRQQAEEAGVDVYLTKPFSDDQLIDHVRSLIHGR